MAPESWAQAQEILVATDEHLAGLGEGRELSLVICPPFVYLEEASKLLNTSHLIHEAQLGAQDIAVEDKGADTGEISGPMLTNLNVRYVIVGHSERRWKMGESDELVNAKLKAVLRNGMVPIVCIGEQTREGDYKSFLRQQILATFAGLSGEDINNCLIAYEPVWAISTNPGAHPDTPESALESIEYIDEVLRSTFHVSRSTFLYGGSVNSKNAEEFLKIPAFSGVLVGGASVKKEEFLKILTISSALTSIH